MSDHPSPAPTPTAFTDEDEREWRQVQAFAAKNAGARWTCTISSDLVQALTAERDSLRTALREAEKRLDWLEANACRIIPAREPMPGSVRTVRGDVLIIAPTIRECIDVHMRAASTPTPEHTP
jgi:hypothetical protein